MLVTQDKIENFGKEIRSVVSSIESNYKSFSCRSDFLMTSEMPVSGNVQCYVSKHLQILRVLSAPSSRWEWIRNPTVKVDNAVLPYLPSEEQDSLIELSCDSLLKVIFTKQPLPDLVVSCPFCGEPLQYLMSPTTYICNKTGSVLYRNMEARSRNHCCRGKAINITYSKCVFVALVIQHAKGMRGIVLSSGACQAVPHFST